MYGTSADTAKKPAHSNTNSSKAVTSARLAFEKKYLAHFGPLDPVWKTNKAIKNNNSDCVSECGEGDCLSECGVAI